MTKRNNLLIVILTIGVFAIINTEMGVMGILPLIAENFHVSISKAGLLVSLFALAVAISGPIMPLLFFGINRRKVMVGVSAGMVLGVPATSLIASATNLGIAMSFFAIVNAIAFTVTLRFNMLRTR